MRTAILMLFLMRSFTGHDVVWYDCDAVSATYGIGKEFSRSISPKGRVMLTLPSLFEFKKCCMGRETIDLCFYT